MGYRCPLCGRHAPTAYAMDSVGYPTCNACNYGANGIMYGVTATQRKMAQLRGIFPMQHLSTVSPILYVFQNGRVFEKVATYLLPERDWYHEHMFS